MRRTRSSYLPLTLSATLMGLNIALMVCWIVLLAQQSLWSAMIIGIVAFALILLGLSFYLVLMIKERRLNQRQMNFVDSVTHELKSPIASLRLYLETLQRRELADDQRREFYDTMHGETQRLESLINQLLEVARLDAIGSQSAREDVVVVPLLKTCASAVSVQYQLDHAKTFHFDVEDSVITASPMVLEAIFRNLFDNAIKYGGEPPRVEVKVKVKKSKVVVQVADNGLGIPPEIRKNILKMFYRGGEELQRRQKGTGLGLYIVQTLVRKLGGKLNIKGRGELSGSEFEVELPGKAAPCES